MGTYKTYLSCGVLVLGLAAPWLISSYELSLLGRFLAMSILAMGLMLIWGEGGILSLGQGVFFGLGGYALAMHLKLVSLDPGSLPDFMQWSGVESLPVWWRPFNSGLFSLIAIVLVPALFAAGFSWLVFRQRVGGVYFALITQAVALAFSTLLVSQQATTGGFNGLTNFQLLFGFDLGAPSTQNALYWVTVLLVAGTYFGLRWLLSTRFGKLLRATRDGENRVRFLGYNPVPYKVLAFALAAALAGIAGALFTGYAGVVSPALVGVVPSISMVVWVALGGRESLPGAIIGTLLVNFAKDEVSSMLPEAWLYVLGAIFVIVVTFLPFGVIGLGDVPLVRRLLNRLPALPGRKQMPPVAEEEAAK